MAAVVKDSYMTHLIILIHLNGKPGVTTEHPTFDFPCVFWK